MLFSRDSLVTSVVYKMLGVMLTCYIRTISLMKDKVIIPTFELRTNGRVGRANSTPRLESEWEGLGLTPRSLTSEPGPRPAGGLWARVPGGAAAAPRALVAGSRPSSRGPGSRSEALLCGCTRTPAPAADVGTSHCLCTAHSKALAVCYPPPPKRTGPASLMPQPRGSSSWAPSGAPGAFGDFPGHPTDSPAGWPHRALVPSPMPCSEGQGLPPPTVIEATCALARL